MSKVKVLRSGDAVSVELGSYYQWWEVNLADGNLTTSVRAGELDGTVQATITPKQLRKIAKTLLKLADEVDPPALKFEYFRHGGCFLRVVEDGHPELWIGSATTRWDQSWAFSTRAQLIANPSIVRISAADLPKAAR